MRARRRDPTGWSVVVTAADAPVGAALSEFLDRTPEVGSVTRVLADTPPSLLRRRLPGADAVVHLDTDTRPDAPPAHRRATTVGGTAALLEAARAASVGRVVLVTTAAVYGAHPDNPVPVVEDGPLRAPAEDSVVGDALAVEALAAAYAGGGRRIAVVRPAALVGPDTDGPVGRLLEVPRLLVVRGGRPRWQFCHVDDLVTALATVVTADLDGVVTVGSDGFLEQAEVERLTGRRRFELSAEAAFGSAERLHRLGLVTGPASEIGYLVHPWVVPSTRLRAAGWAAQHDNAGALLAHLDSGAGRRSYVDRAGAARAAAGATVALVGSAALLRRARRRRRRG